MGHYLKVWASRAVELGATIDDGINWTWANGFPTLQAAEQFIKEFPEMETRGVYPDRDVQGNTTGYSVRFRC